MVLGGSFREGFSEVCSLRFDQLSIDFLAKHQHAKQIENPYVYTLETRWVVYEPLSGSREELQGGCLDRFNITVFHCSDNFPDESSINDPYTSVYKHVEST